ncbi:phosphate ABC transporter permease PstA [Iamia majanohamensis]|uniref:Phosphate transport system permease protein PstA n=1 Tax=Iamia majanohamensis TaxID=467976 RepID=A0AAE9Y884_9ACTN|nr:phosphate ABC transporter permease PstA [Iamia majanohamensis]WCO67531.1 phosphate ABC transporter permease PstA [Iamia majanohamensis]
MTLIPADITRDVVEAKLRGQKADVAGAAFRYLLLACLGLVLAALMALLWNVSSVGVPYLADRGLVDFLSRYGSSQADIAGVYQALAGTIQMGIIIMVVAFPLGVATAVYMEEYASDTIFTRAVGVVIRNLAGVPAIVYGLLGAALFARGGLEGLTGRESLLSAGLTLSILVLPIVVITSAEALRSVPASLREGGFGAGATRWEVVRTLVLPNAFPGILTGTILSLARGLGEAAPLLLIGAKDFFSGGEFGDLTGNFTSLPYLIARWSKLPSTQGWPDNTQAAIVVTLVVILGINVVGILLRNHYEKRTR